MKKTAILFAISFISVIAAAQKIPNSNVAKIEKGKSNLKTGHFVIIFPDLTRNTHHYSFQTAARLDILKPGHIA